MPTTVQVKKRAEELKRKKERAKRRREIIAQMGPFVRLASCSAWNSGTPTVTLQLHCGHFKRVDRLAAYPTAGGERFARCAECQNASAEDRFAFDLTEEEQDAMEKHLPF